MSFNSLVRRLKLCTQGTGTETFSLFYLKNEKTRSYGGDGESYLVPTRLTPGRGGGGVELDVKMVGLLRFGARPELF
jgi:hypothetical protein